MNEHPDPTEAHPEVHRKEGPKDRKLDRKDWPDPAAEAKREREADADA